MIAATAVAHARTRAGAWSKTMIGYGPEEEGFALELTYNYGIDGYKNGDDLQYICLQLDVEATKAKAEAEGKGDSVRVGVYTTENLDMEDIYTYAAEILKISVYVCHRSMEDVP